MKTESQKSFNIMSNTIRGRHYGDEGVTVVRWESVNISRGTVGGIIEKEKAPKTHEMRNHM